MLLLLAPEADEPTIGLGQREKETRLRRRVQQRSFRGEGRDGMEGTPCCQLDISSELISAPLHRRTIAQTEQESQSSIRPKGLASRVRTRPTPVLRVRRRPG